MTVRRTIRCDICKVEYTEREPGDGFPNWGQLHGISLNGVQNPNLCPEHLHALAERADELACAEPAER